MRFASFCLVRTSLLDASFEGGHTGRALGLPEVREAIEWASPSLAKAMTDGSLAKLPPAPRFALARYVARMAGRATPFMLMAGYSSGRVYGEDTRIRLSSRSDYRRIVRIDQQAVRRLLRAAALEDVDGSHWIARGDIIPFRTILRIMVRDDIGGDVTALDIDRSPAVDAVLAAATQRSSFGMLVSAALPFSPGLPDAEGFVRELIALDVLLPAGAASILVEDELTPLLSHTRTRAVAERLRALRDTPLHVEAPVPKLGDFGLGQRDLIVDLVKPTDGEALLGRDVLRPLTDIVTILRRSEYVVPDARMDAFIRQFGQRYEMREVPLVEALASGHGIPFSAKADRTMEPPIGEIIRRWKLSLFARSQRDNSPIELRTAELPPTDPLPLPDTFSIVFSLLRDPFEIWSPTVVGAPPGTSTFARSTALLSSSFRQLVVDHLATAAARHIETDTADVAYFVPGKSSSFGQYPPLQPADLVLTAAAGEAARSLDVRDILLSVRDGRPRLRSRQTGRFLLVRPTSAVNPDIPVASDLFRFLYALPLLDGRGFEWTWGPLAEAPALPRVTFEGHVISPARWALSAEDTLPLRQEKTRATRFMAVQELRRAHGLPPRVRYVEGADHQLPVNLDNEESVEAWLDIARERMQLIEAMPVARSAVVGPEGPFHHEIVVPATNFSAGTVQANPSELGSLRAAENAFDDVLPGGDVLYLRLTADRHLLLRILAELAHDVIRPAVNDGLVSHWFFLPYGNDDTELRLRFFGPSVASNTSRLVAAARASLSAWLESRVVRDVSIETYHRETYRYGGGSGMDAAERFFGVSSEIALRLHGEHDFLDPSSCEQYLVPHVGVLRAILRATGASLDEQYAIAQLAAASFDRQTDPRASREMAAKTARVLRVSLGQAERSSTTEGDRLGLEQVLRGFSVRELIAPFSSWMADCLHTHSVRLLTTWHPLPHLEIVSYQLLVKVIAGELRSSPSGSV
jgi:thiopeptide-type bacteriocin biosynthesis protein